MSKFSYFLNVFYGINRMKTKPFLRENDFLKQKSEITPWKFEKLKFENRE